MVGGVKVYYAVLLALVLGVGCGGGKEEVRAVKVTSNTKAKAGAEKPLTKEAAAKIIETAIRKAIKKPTGELTEADLEKVTELDLVADQLTSVRGLEKLTQLTSLGLAMNQLTDVPKGLKKLTQLEGLNLRYNKLTNVKGLENLTQLERLYLNGNQLTNVTGLENLTKLERLFLNNNPDLTKAQIAELKKALPKCTIYSNPTK